MMLESAWIPQIKGASAGLLGHPYARYHTRWTAIPAGQLRDAGALVPRPPKREAIPYCSAARPRMVASPTASLTRLEGRTYNGITY